MHRFYGTPDEKTKEHRILVYCASVNTRVITDNGPARIQLLHPRDCVDVRWHSFAKSARPFTYARGRTHARTHILSRNLQVCFFPFYDQSFNQSGNYTCIYRHTHTHISTARPAHRTLVSSPRLSQHTAVISPQKSKRFVFIKQNVFSLRCELILCALCRHYMARLSVTGRWQWRPGFNPWSFSVRLIVNKVALCQVFLRVLRVSSARNSPSMLYTHPHLKTAFIRRLSGRSLGHLRATFTRQ